MKKEFICVQCGSKFLAYISKKQKFCGRGCFKKSKVFTHNIPHTNEANEKNRKAHLGKEVPSMKGHKYWGGITGEKNWFEKGSKPWNYQGGERSLSKMIKDDKRYKPWREAVFRRDDWVCQNCKKRGGKLEAHHIKSKTKYIELAFDVDNGQTLCKECHKLTDNYAGRTNKKN